MPKKCTLLSKKNGQKVCALESNAAATNINSCFSLFPKSENFVVTSNTMHILLLLLLRQCHSRCEIEFPANQANWYCGLFGFFYWPISTIFFLLCPCPKIFCKKTQSSTICTNQALLWSLYGNGNEKLNGSCQDDFFLIQHSMHWNVCSLSNSIKKKAS